MDWRSIVSAVFAVLGSASTIAGVQCLITHWGVDLSYHWHDCLALIAGGAAVASPGLNTLKAGIFQRPRPQQTKDPLSGEKR